MIPQLLMAAVLGMAAPRMSEVDLVTVTDTGFALTFATNVPAPAAVIYGTEPGKLGHEAKESGAPTRFHYLCVQGLSPGLKYYFRVKSGTSLKPLPPLPPRSFTTLVPPPGRLLFSFGIINDIHVMEDIAGVIFLPGNFLPPLTPGFTWKNPADNYWSFTLRATVAALNRSGADFTVVNGDLTSWFGQEEFETAKSYLDRLTSPYYVTRGNHDRVEDAPEDYFKTTFGLKSSWYSLDHKGFHFVFLDDSRLEDGFMLIAEEEFDWLRSDLGSHRHMPTFLFEHRPVAADWVDVNKRERLRLLRILAQNPQVVGVFNAHTHRAKVTRVPSFTKDVPHIEVPAVKEYPVGYGMVRVYEGGFMYNFFTTPCQDCLEWNHITRGEYFGFAPQMLNHRLSDRNLVYIFPPPLRAEENKVK